MCHCDRGVRERDQVHCVPVCLCGRERDRPDLVYVCVISHIPSLVSVREHTEVSHTDPSFFNSAYWPEFVENKTSINLPSHYSVLFHSSLSLSHGGAHTHIVLDKDAYTLCRAKRTAGH